MVFGFVFAHSMFQLWISFISFLFDLVFFFLLCFHLFIGYWVWFCYLLLSLIFRSLGVWCDAMRVDMEFELLFFLLILHLVPCAMDWVKISQQHVVVRFVGEFVKRWRVAGTHYSRIIDHVNRLPVCFHYCLWCARYPTSNWFFFIMRHSVGNWTKLKSLSLPSPSFWRSLSLHLSFALWTRNHFSSHTSTWFFIWSWRRYLTQDNDLKITFHQTMNVSHFFLFIFFFFFSVSLNAILL